MMHSAECWRPGSAIAPDGSTGEVTLGRSTDERTSAYYSGSWTASRQLMRAATMLWGFLQQIYQIRKMKSQLCHHTLQKKTCFYSKFRFCLYQTFFIIKFIYNQGF